uniref:Protein kinase domain-containing protein n=1 Tax=Peronospora matthiolae TaxID=2874970 RepID=A0AAV1T553_9STRA
MHGVCSSPLSSIDGEEDAASATGFGFVPSPESKQSTRRLAGKKSRAKARKTIVPSRKRRKPTAAGKKSTQTLVQAAPRDFVAYLVEQLTTEQQNTYATEFGTTQDALVQLPAIEQWPNKRQRAALSRWLRALGFVSSATLKESVFCVDKTVADSVRAALMEDASTARSSDAHNEAVFGSDGCLLGNGSAHQREKRESDAEMVRLQKHYEKMEAMTVEILSFSEYRMLSSLHHEVIADAMESVLARSSVRRDRRLARRRSMLGRTSARRLSIGRASPCRTHQPLVADRVRDREKTDTRMSLTAVKCRVSPGDRGLAGKKTFQGERVLCLILYSGLIDVKSFKEVLRKVSIRAYAWIIADYSKKANFCSMAELYRRHPRGHHHASGAYKEVYKVFSFEQNRLEAISMMDISALEDIGNQSVIRQEVAHSVLLSHATEDGICPNFLRVYDVFLAPDQPRPDLWGNRAHRKPVKLLAEAHANPGAEVCEKDVPVCPSNESERLFQYIRMEFCDGGDLENFVGLQKDKALPVACVAVPFFFQMVYSMYCARERFSLRHCDIKLLNFFLKDIGCTNRHKDSGSDVTLHYLLEDMCFVLRMPASFSYWVKLADYGAADSNPENLGKPVTIDQFTTLENSPIEHLLEGDAAEQSYAADTFCLGLCMLHLFTGSGPYEELMEDVRCPTELLKGLTSIWMSSRKNSGFSVIKKVARGDDVDTLCHTLYRFIVLFGLPGQNPSESKGINKVWQLLLTHLRPEDPALTRFQRRSRRTKGVCEAQVLAKSQFDKDKSLYSIASGSNDIIRRGRERLQSVSGAMELLNKLVDFDPAKRPTLKQVMYHPVFSGYRMCDDATSPDYVISYYKNRHQGGHMISDV